MGKKYREIFESLRKDIQDGVYAEGDFLPTEIELTKTFSVSRPTVAKALEMLRAQGSIERRSGYGTVVTPSKLSRGLRIGLLIPRLGETEIFEPICRAVEDEGRLQHWDVIRPGSKEAVADISERTTRLCRTFIREGLDAVIFTPVEHIPQGERFNARILNQLQEAGIPVVLLDRDVVPWPAQSPHDLISIDNIQAGYVIASHLIQQGCRKLLFTTRPEPAVTVQLRIMGCREALQHTGLPADSLMIENIQDPSESMDVQELMKRSPDALICANDATAAILMRRLLDAGVDIPGQLKVAGFDDVKYASLLSVPLTTYHQPCEDLGRNAVHALQQRLKYPQAAPRRITLQGHLIARHSTEG